MERPSEVLGVAPDADEDEIERAYRRRVKEVHPDRGGSVEAFIAVQRAYERLLAGEDAPPKPAESAEGAPPRGADTGTDPEVVSRVRYLNYEVLDDFGWTLEDDDLFERAAAADLAAVDHGRFEVRRGESLLEAAESRGFVWPFACRGGACANCAVFLVEGDLPMQVDHVLPDDLLDRGFRLSCNARPESQTLKVVYNVKRVPELDDLLLPPGPFARVQSDD